MTYSQDITSAATSLNQVPAGYKTLAKVGLLDDCDVFDFGAGKYETAANWAYLTSRANVVGYDRYNISEFDNESALEELRLGFCNYIVCFNVLNVLTDDVLPNVVAELAKLAQHTTEKRVYIGVYEGNKSGNGAVTKKGYQRHSVKKDYLKALQPHFKSVSIKHGLIIATLNSEA